MLACACSPMVCPIHVSRASKGSLAVPGAWVWELKDWIDRQWSTYDLPPPFPPSPLPPSPCSLSRTLSRARVRSLQVTSISVSLSALLSPCIALPHLSRYCCLKIFRLYLYRYLHLYLPLSLFYLLHIFFSHVSPSFSLSTTLPPGVMCKPSVH